MTIHQVERDVVVVGAGTTGLVAALGLARAGLQVEVLETASPERLPWTAMHHWSVLDGLFDLGVLDQVLAEGCRASQWGVRVLATGEDLRFDLAELPDDVRFPFNVRMEHGRLQDILTGALLSYDNVMITRRSELRSLTQHQGGVWLEVPATSGASRLLAARWVVAADGITSAVRRHVGAGFEGSTWPERCVAALVDHDFAEHGYADTTFQIDGRLGAVVERANDGLWRYVYEESLALPEETIGDRIPEVIELATCCRVSVVDWTTGRMHQRSAASYRHGRVVLLGEAAHATHKLLGRSPISSYFDAFSVAPVLAGVSAGTLDDAAVTEWADRRRRIFLDDVVPSTAARKNLLTQITDPRRRDVELDHYRRALGDPVARRELLLQGAELGAGAAQPEPARP